MKRLLILSPAFPPLNAADLHRVRMSLPHYQRNGWEVEVVCVDPSQQEHPKEPALLETIPSSIPIHQACAFPLSLGARFGVRNTGLRSLPFVFLKVLRLLTARHFDLVFISSTQFVLFPLGRIWTLLTGVPCVLDLHDPWVSDAYDKPGAPPPPGGWKFTVAQVMAKALEGWSMRGAAGLLSVSPVYITTIQRRYPCTASTPSAVIEFGASQQDMECAGLGPSPLPDDGRIHLVYTGASGPGLHGVIPAFLDGLALLHKTRPNLAEQLHVHFIGTCQVAEGLGTPTVAPLAAARGLSDLVTEVPHRLGHLECLRYQQHSDVLLLLGSLDPAYSPSKLYPYITAGRPLLCVAVQGGALAAKLSELRCGSSVVFSSVEQIAPAVAKLLARVADESQLEDVANRDMKRFRQHYLAEALTARQAGFFEEVLASHAGKRTQT